MDESLIGYALKALPPNDMADLDHRIANDPALKANLDRLRRFLVRLSADAERDPPPGLAVSALAAVAAHIVEHKLPLEGTPPATPARCPTASDVHPVLGDIDPAEQSFEELPPVPVSRAYPFHRWFEISIVAGIAFLAVGLVVTGIAKIRHESQIAACRKNMLEIYNGLSLYAETHHEQFPKVGTPAAPNAGSFVTELHVARSLMPNVHAACPVTQPADPTRVTYVYTLGYLANGELQGIRRRVQDISDELTPLLADLPTPKSAPTDGPVSPHGQGQNILFADGHICYSRIATVGPNGDDIYQNQNGHVRAGLHRLDASLGRATDIP